MAITTLTRQIAAGLSEAASTRVAARDAARQAAEELHGDVDLAVVLMSPHHLVEAHAAVFEVETALAPRQVLGCVAQGVVARGREVEEAPGLAVWAASLPGADVRTFHASAVETEEGVVFDGVPSFRDASMVVLLADPFSFPVDRLLESLNHERPGLPIVGGIPIGGGQPGLQSLVGGGEIDGSGAVGAVISGVPALALVSQGCAPIGPDLVVTAAEENLVQELAGRRALDVLRSVVGGLSPREQILAAEGVLVGLVIDENKPEYGRGDYLMRGLFGGEPVSGALAVGAPVRVGQTLRFHVRDADTAHDDLCRALEDAVTAGTPTGALLFTCNGRGTNLFAEPDHDARLVSSALGPAVAGFFCGGEIGPVGGRAFLHGFTATLAVFLRD
jgi:small ligand-binding sensory domain FIST